MKKAIKDGLTFLGKDYSFAIIDFGECIYRDLGDYDIEIIHIKRNILGERGYKIYLWKKKPLKIIKNFCATESLRDLKKMLDGVVEEYERKKDRR